MLIIRQLACVKYTLIRLQSTKISNKIIIIIIIIITNVLFSSHF